MRQMMGAGIIFTICGVLLFWYSKINYDKLSASAKKYLGTSDELSTEADTLSTNGMIGESLSKRVASVRAAFNSMRETEKALDWIPIIIISVLLFGIGFLAIVNSMTMPQ